MAAKVTKLEETMLTCGKFPEKVIAAPENFYRISGIPRNIDLANTEENEANGVHQRSTILAMPTRIERR